MHRPWELKGSEPERKKVLGASATGGGPEIGDASDQPIAAGSRRGSGCDHRWRGVSPDAFAPEAFASAASNGDRTGEDGCHTGLSDEHTDADAVETMLLLEDRGKPDTEHEDRRVSADHHPHAAQDPRPAEGEGGEGVGHRGEGE